MGFTFALNLIFWQSRGYTYATFSIIFFAISFSIQAFCFRLTPMTQVFESSGSGANQPFLVENNSSELIAVQIRMATRDPDVNGKEEYKEIQDHFSVYPSQLILKPGKKRTVRVTYKGNDKKLVREKAYRIIAEQLPVKDLKTGKQKGGAVIQILLRYVGAVYVTPEGAKPKTKVVAIEKVLVDQTVDKKKAKKRKTIKIPKLAVTLENEGNKHHILLNAKLKIRTASGKKWQKISDIKGLEGENILAGYKRKFLIAWPKNLKGKSFEGKISFN